MFSSISHYLSDVGKDMASATIGRPDPPQSGQGRPWTPLTPAAHFSKRCLSPSATPLAASKNVSTASPLNRFSEESIQK